MKTTVRTLTTRIAGVVFLGVIAGALIFMVIRYIIDQNETHGVKRIVENQAAGLEYAKCRDGYVADYLSVTFNALFAPTPEARAIAIAEGRELNKVPLKERIQREC